MEAPSLSCLKHEAGGGEGGLGCLSGDPSGPESVTAGGNRHLDKSIAFGGPQFPRLSSEGVGENVHGSVRFSKLYYVRGGS